MLSNVCVCVNNNVIQFFHIFILYLCFFDLEQIKRAVSQIYIFSIIFFLVFCRCGGGGGVVVVKTSKKRVFIYGEFCRSSFGILLSIYL